MELDSQGTDEHPQSQGNVYPFVNQGYEVPVQGKAGSDEDENTHVSG